MVIGDAGVGVRGGPTGLRNLWHLQESEAVMPSGLSIRAVHGGGMRVTVSSGEHELVSDYPLRPGEQTAGLEVEVKGERRDDHPTVLTHIAMTVTIHGSGVDKAKVDEAIAQADARLCPVWAMLKPATRIETTVCVSPG